MACVISAFDCRTILKPTSQMKVTVYPGGFPRLMLFNSHTDVKHLQENDLILEHVRDYVSNDRWPHNSDVKTDFYKTTARRNWQIDEIRYTRSFSKRYPEDDVVLPRCWGHLCIDNSIVKFCHAVSGLICKNKSTVSSEHATGVFSKLNLKLFRAMWLWGITGNTNYRKTWLNFSGRQL